MLNELGGPLEVLMIFVDVWDIGNLTHLSPSVTVYLLFKNQFTRIKIKFIPVLF